MRRRRVYHWLVNVATVVSLLMFIGAVRVTKWTHHAAKTVHSRATHWISGQSGAGW